MIDFLDKWTREIELILKHREKGTNWKRVLNDHRAVIGFLQHERLIHLMVTLAVAGMFLVTVLFSLVLKSVFLGLVGLLLVGLLLPYIWHYFRLENGVQKLYFLDLKIQKQFNGDHG